jgi:hypothetical protein
MVQAKLQGSEHTKDFPLQMGLPNPIEVSENTCTRLINVLDDFVFFI